MAYNRQALFVEVARRLSIHPRTRLSRLAQELKIERHTIELAVRENLSISFRKYQNLKILDEALPLLAERPNLTIKEIAAILGYQSFDSFSRFIRRSTGKKPTDHRRQP